MALVESLPHVEAVIVDAAGNVVVSRGLQGKIDIGTLSSTTGP